MTPIQRVANAIGEGLDVADPLVGDVVEERDLLAAAKAALTCLIDMADDERVKLWLQAMLEG